MYLYVELWNAKPAWLELSVDERRKRVKSIESSVNAMHETGVAILGFAIADTDTPHRADYRYIAVWQMPSIDSAHGLEKGLEESGWHEYFEQVNGRGLLKSPSEVLHDMAHLGES